jgi:hypothetical protein
MPAVELDIPLFTKTVMLALNDMSSPGWQSAFRRTQSVTQLVINSREYGRVRYGDEEDALQHSKCDDCGVLRSFHLLGCDLEQCPRCLGQIISCDCFFDERPGEPPLKMTIASWLA